MISFDNKSVLVTGAGSGIGAATARRFSALGAHVALIGRTGAKLEAVARELPSERTLVIAADVAEEPAIRGAIEQTVERFGGLDTLVNNAGVARMGAADAVSLEDWATVMAVNASGVFYASRAALPYLKARGGSIVNTASVSGVRGDWGLAAYDASKGAVVNLTRAMALDHGAEGVRINAVAPSLTRTEMTAGLMESEALLAKFAERIPMGRAAEPEEVADAILFLASEAARFVNGVILPVDGGLSAANGQPKIG